MMGLSIIGYLYQTWVKSLILGNVSFGVQQQRLCLWKRSFQVLRACLIRGDEFG